MTTPSNPLAAAANRSALSGAGGISGAAQLGGNQPAPAQSSSPLTSLAHIAGVANAAKSLGGLAGAAEDAAPLLAMHNGTADFPGGVVPGDPSTGDSQPAMLQPGEKVTPAKKNRGPLMNDEHADRQWSASRTFSPTGPPADRSTSQFTPVGSSLDGLVSDLSWPRAGIPGVTLVPRGPVCSVCMLPQDQHASAADHTPLASVPGVHQDVDSGAAHNAADELPGAKHDPRLGEFGVGSGQ